LTTNGQVSSHPEPPLAISQQAKRVNPMKAKKLQERAKELEGQIATLEAEIASDEAQLANFVSAEESVRIAGQLEKRRDTLNALLQEWEAVSQEA